MERTVLLVEDSEDDVAITLRALKRSECDARVVVLRDGAEALAFLESLEDSSQSETPAAIFLDLKMPRVSGKEVLRATRKNRRTHRVPVIVVSSTGRSEEVEECYELGANSFISKRYGELSPGAYMVDAIRYWLNLNATPGLN